MPANSVRFLDTTPGDQAIALKQYMDAFTQAPRNSVFLFNKNDKIKRKTVTSGKSWQFLMFGKSPGAEDFNPGDRMTGQAYGMDEGTITADKYLLESAFIRQDDMKTSHVEILTELAQNQKAEIERKYDKRLFTVAALGARAAAVNKTVNGTTLNIHNGGNRVTSTGGAVATQFALTAAGAAKAVLKLRALGQLMDENNIGPEREVYTTPHMRNCLLCDTTGQVFSRDYNSGNDINKRKILEVAGFSVMDYPNTTTNGGAMPDENITNEAFSKYNGNFTVQAADGTPVFLAFAKDRKGGKGVGVVSFDDIKPFVHYEQLELGWYVGAYILCGAGLLNPWCLGSVEAII